MGSKSRQCDRNNGRDSRGCRWLDAGPGSVVARPPAGNIGKSVDEDGWSVARDEFGWDGMGRAGEWGILKRGRARRVAARGGRRGENDEGMGRDVARLTRCGTACGMGRAMAHSVRPKGWPEAKGEEGG